MRCASRARSSPSPSPRPPPSMKTARWSTTLQEAATILARLAGPTGVRVRLYDIGRRLTADSYDLWPAGSPIEVSPLPPARSDGARFSGISRRVRRRSSTEPGQARWPRTEIHPEVPVPGVSEDEEVRLAAEGQVAHSVRVNGEGELIVSVAMPVRQIKGIIGVLQLSTSVGGEIERFVRRGAQDAVPDLPAGGDRLGADVDRARQHDREPDPPARPCGAIRRRRRRAAVSPDKPEIPDLTHRTDEIGELSGALIRHDGRALSPGSAPSRASPPMSRTRSRTR